MSTPSSPGSPTQYTPSWQKQLHDYCKQNRMMPPVWGVVSDKRGGRTAWSAYVTTEGLHAAARYWYDGQYLNNAKEDAAEVALQKLRVVPSPTSPTRALVRAYTAPTSCRNSQ